MFVNYSTETRCSKNITALISGNNIIRWIIIQEKLQRLNIFLHFWSERKQHFVHREIKNFLAITLQCKLHQFHLPSTLRRYSTSSLCVRPEHCAQLHLRARMLPFHCISRLLCWLLKTWCASQPFPLAQTETSRSLHRPSCTQDDLHSTGQPQAWDRGWSSL